MPERSDAMKKSVTVDEKSRKAKVEPSNIHLHNKCRKPCGANGLEGWGLGRFG